MSEWRPIDTAPKDGRPILLWGRCSGEIYGKYDEDCAVVGSFCSAGVGWSADVGDCYTTEIDPTHWMPLPEPPK